MAFLSLQFNSFLIISAILLFSAFFAAGQSDCALKLGFSLTTEDTSPWSSPSGEFAFGFRRLQRSPSDNEDLFLLAIWFNKIPEQTIVWSKNEFPVPQGSKVELTNEGKLILYDSQGIEIWTAPSNGRSTCAAMLNSGNFVLINGDSNIWESFKEPTDVILPDQTISMGTYLYARQSETNYTKGKFRLSMQRDGNLVLYPIVWPSEDTSDAYWASNTQSSNPDVQLIFDTAGYLYLKDGKENILNITEKDMGSPQEFYHMARIDSDGVFRAYNHPRKNYAADAKGCTSAWSTIQSIPEDLCKAVIGDLGSGACGYNSYCFNSNGKPQCRCPEGYSPVDSLDMLKGCKPNFQLPSCQQNGWELNMEFIEFKELNETDWPLNDYELRTGSRVDKDTCKEFCLQDCFCAAVIYDKNYCWKKKFPLSNGRQSAGLTRTALIKVPKSNTTDLCLKRKDQSTLVLVGSLLLGSSVFLNFLLLLTILVGVFFIYHKKMLNLQFDSTTFGLRRYTYKELEEATGGFKQQLGRGAFGTVYKGVTPSLPKRYIAVKTLNKVEPDGEKEFKTEVQAIGQTHHKNLVTLLGYCDEGENRLLVYEYMSNGSLATLLFGVSRPHWNQRLQIVCGIARGLMYLHEECSTQIIHCDVKPQNILLDEFLMPKISDFGLAKLLLAEQSRAARTNIRGTVGYFAPEWFRKASITVKVDIYSFGVMLLEIICCKSSVVFAMGEEEEALIDWAYDCYSKKKLNKMVENDEEARNDMKSVERLVMVAIWCIQEDPSIRPSMRIITQMLEGVAEVPIPPRPSVFSSS
ncbi:G-type lectin S-receptor-like serine/threonine-protein kinase LECRK3 [Olea europaea var. sylvestris]|uniref:G-type lectin S-receptor-like serine/threonine-protein kinase LECRK3 n=1 Tax=Olea europaea var. sylvestris TaxID=158386 RepID=UPI000C1CD45B|nr:G-type lectin S-receptor-like serine/threonine-protein kinase LECRK3 [Olea europaea var. sylvestris]